MKEAVLNLDFGNPGAVHCQKVGAAVCTYPQSVSRGVQLKYKMPGCVCWISENIPILNDTFSCKNIPISNGTFPEFIPNFDGNIKMELLTYRYHLFPLIAY